MLSYFHRFSVFVWAGIFWKRTKNICSKISRHRDPNMWFFETLFYYAKKGSMSYLLSTVFSQTEPHGKIFYQILWDTNIPVNASLHKKTHNKLTANKKFSLILLLGLLLLKTEILPQKSKPVNVYYKFINRATPLSLAKSKYFYCQNDGPGRSILTFGKRLL